MKTPTTLAQWFFLFEGEPISHFKKEDDVSHHWAKDIWKIYKKRIKILWISDYTICEATDWGRRFIVWLNKSYEAGCTSAGDEFYIDKPKKKHTKAKIN